ncbi:MAG: glycosyltransferase [Infirmifilum sp.]
MKFIELVFASLRSVFDLDYEDFEVIIVDNGSTDGSFEAIKSFVNKVRPKCRVKIIQNDRNRVIRVG